jgi:anti-sigma factor RsiW
MNCREIRPLISAYMDNELTPAQLRVMQRHVEGCADCAATMETYRRMRGAGVEGCPGRRRWDEGR